jgi:hypothetical protein
MNSVLPKSKTVQNSMPWDNILLAAVMLSTASILAWILGMGSYGFDFTDESFYIVWIANPYLYAASTTQFGFVYHPLYLLLDGNIALLRQANMLITFGLGWAMVSVFLSTLQSREILNNFSRHVVSSSLATASLVFLHTWLPSPSYNSLALQALLLASTGFLMASATYSRSSVLGWILIGLGGWLAFMAKPTTAAALALFMCLGVVTTNKSNFRLILLSITVALLALLVSALAIDDSVLKFFDRLTVGAKYLEDLGGGHTMSKILRLDSIVLNQNDKLLLAYASGTALLGALLLRFGNHSFQLISVGLCVLLAISIIAGTIGGAKIGFDLSVAKGLMMLAVPATALILTLLPKRSDDYVMYWFYAVYFFAMPYAFAFGTNNNYWHAGSSAGIFWAMSGFALLAPMLVSRERVRILILLVLVTQVILVLLLQTGQEDPYRQPQPLKLNSQSTNVGRAGSTLMLSAGYSSYIIEATSVAKKAGFEPGTPMIDLTGQSAGILYALQAQNIGQAWIIGGYPGSLKLASEALKSVPCQTLVNAWLLIEPKGPRSIPDQLLDNLGMDFKENYVFAATWLTARGAGGYATQRQQVLYKPISTNPKKLKACVR